MAPTPPCGADAGVGGEHSIGTIQLDRRCDNHPLHGPLRMRTKGNGEEQMENRFPYPGSLKRASHEPSLHQLYYEVMEGLPLARISRQTNAPGTHRALAMKSDDFQNRVLFPAVHRGQVIQRYTDRTVAPLGELSGKGLVLS